MREFNKKIYKYLKNKYKHYIGIFGKEQKVKK